VKGGRTTRSRASTFVKPTAPQGEAAGSVATEGESSKQESLPTWSEDFDPIAFVADNLKGYSSRLDALSLEELCKLAVGSGLKCLVLNQMVFTLQEKEASEKLEKEVGTTKENLERSLADELAKSQASINKSLAKEKKRLNAMKKDNRNLVLARNSMIVALVKIWKDAGERDADKARLQGYFFLFTTSRVSLLIVWFHYAHYLIRPSSRCMLITLKITKILSLGYVGGLTARM
jgi:hypothetical protein